MGWVRLRYTSPTGEKRAWTLKEIVQGRPLGHPSHPMFVHFPVAFYVGALLFDLASKVYGFSIGPRAATWLIVGAFAATVPAVTTGLVEWAGIAAGSRMRRWATTHMILQLTAFSFFAVNLAIRWPQRGTSEAEWLWIILGALGVGFMSLGQWYGGILVYQMGMGVSTTGADK